jgi:hypothetical protein
VDVDDNRADEMAAFLSLACGAFGQQVIRAEFSGRAFYLSA